MIGSFVFNSLILVMVYFNAHISPVKTEFEVEYDQ